MPENNPNDPAAQENAIERISIKIPPFWPEKPSLWFVQLEGQFALNNITRDVTKYYYVTANLDTRYALEVEDILLNPPELDKYATIKTELIKRLSTSREQKIKQLLEHEEVGDRTPSQFLRHLKNLAGAEVPEDFLRTLWTARLPSSMQAILTTQTNTDLNATATLADKIAETTRGTIIASTAADSQVAQLSKQLDGRIHDATVKLHAGGVGRNITEALSKLGCNPTFISVVGNDSNGQYLCSLLPASCSEGVKKLADFNTAQCTIIFDSHGECKMLIGDMEVHQQITPNMIKSQEEVIRKSPLLVLDANLSLPTLSTALELAEEHNIPVFFEPTDVPISSKPFQTSYWKAIKYITPNLLELKEIANALNIPLSTNNLNEIEEASYLAKLIADYIPNIIVTLGSNGLLMARRANASDPLFQHQSVVDTKAEINLRHYPAEKVSDVVNVSGAGDCLASGIIAAMLRGCSEEECVKVGFAAARTALYSNSAVPSILFDQTHESWLSKAIYQTIH